MRVELNPISKTIHLHSNYEYAEISIKGGADVVACTLDRLGHFMFISF